MERINLAVVVAALVVLVMSAVKPEARLGDYQLVLGGSQMTVQYVINTDTSEIWVELKDGWESLGKADD